MVRQPVRFFVSIFLVLAFGVLAAPGAALAKDPRAIVGKLDSDGDGKVSRAEWPRSQDAFDQIDADGDGQLTVSEFGDFFAGKNRERQKQPAKQSAAQPTPAPQGQVPVAAAVRPQGMDGWQGPIIDAHSQIDERTDLDEIVPKLDRAGVQQVILSTRFDQPGEVVLDLARRHPGRIVPAAKTKTKSFMKGRGDAARLFQAELAKSPYRAMAEIIMWHAAKKGVGAGRAVIAPDDPRLAPMIAAARAGGFPFLIHIETGDMGTEKAGYIGTLETLISANPDVAFGVIHMGQMDLKDTAALLIRHANLFFITSHCNPVTVSNSKLPWTLIFDGDNLKPDWKALIESQPDRFVLAFDNVFGFHWRDYFIPQVEVWRKALAGLPDDVAHKLAHGNAERLWKLAAVH